MLRKNAHPGCSAAAGGASGAAAATAIPAAQRAAGGAAASAGRWRRAASFAAACIQGSIMIQKKKTLHVSYTRVNEKMTIDNTSTVVLT